MSHSHKCCQRQKLRRGLWSPDEDERLLAYIVKYGPGHWSSIPERAGIERCGKSCRLRWINYLRPDLKRGPYSESEELRIIELHKVYGNRWSKIASHLPGRTDNEIKNLWNSRLRKEAEEKSSASANLSASGARLSAERGAQLNKNGELLTMPYHIGNTISLACSPASPTYPFQASQAEIAGNQHDHQNANPDRASKAAAETKTHSQQMLCFNNGLIVPDQELCTDTLQGGFIDHLPMAGTDNHAIQNNNYKLLQLQNAASYIHAAGSYLARNTETDIFQQQSHETLMWIRHLIKDHASDSSSSVQQFPFQHQYDLQVSDTSKSTSSTCSEDSINIPSLLENQDVTEFWFEEAFPGM